MRTGTLLLLFLLGCANEETGPAATKERPETKPAVISLKLSSTTFAAGQRMPKRCASRPEGKNRSPQLSWKGAPEGTKEFALICDDPDAPRAEPWVHWVLYRIPASTTSLQEGAKGVGVAGRNDFGELGWGGPLPPRGHGVHRYRFRLYALDRALDLAPGASRAALAMSVREHILAESELAGTYSID
ncbi:MAG: YbhB/YbcL family Raf kinase inhibitor-like protein [Planctomycetota bacterium]|jgi:Raf kinase inhibitor-like YbhB/YbcL family protein